MSSGLQIVPPTLLEGRRISGNKNIVPDDDTKLESLRANLTKVAGGSASTTPARSRM